MRDMLRGYGFVPCGAAVTSPMEVYEDLGATLGGRLLGAAAVAALVQAGNIPALLSCKDGGRSGGSSISSEAIVVLGSQRGGIFALREVCGVADPRVGMLGRSHPSLPATSHHVYCGDTLCLRIPSHHVCCVYTLCVVAYLVTVCTVSTPYAYLVTMCVLCPHPPTRRPQNTLSSSAAALLI